MSHLTEDDKKKISNMIARHFKFVEIAREIEWDPTTIAKEIIKDR